PHYLSPSTLPPPPIPTPFPYTTLFRSLRPSGDSRRLARRVGVAAPRLQSPLPFLSGPARPKACFAGRARARLLCQLGHRGHRRRSEEHTSELQSRFDLVCRLLLEKKNR